MRVQVAVVHLPARRGPADHGGSLGQPMQGLIFRRLRDPSLTDEGKNK